MYKSTLKPHLFPHWHCGCCRIHNQPLFESGEGRASASKDATTQLATECSFQPLQRSQAFRWLFKSKFWSTIWMHTQIARGSKIEKRKEACRENHEALEPRSQMRSTARETKKQADQALHTALRSTERPATQKGFKESRIFCALSAGSSTRSLENTNFHPIHTILLPSRTLRQLKGTSKDVKKARQAATISGATSLRNSRRPSST